MSAGHHAKGGMDSADVNRVLAKPEVKTGLATSYGVNQDYDLPYLAGYSKDGGTVYIDRHLPTTIKAGPSEFDPRPFLETHEHVEKSVIDGLGYKYAAAHEIATAAERRQVVAAGHNWGAYEKALAPFIKADERERIERVPADLDMTPYLGETELEKHMREAM